jgi:hypothetical protein
MNVPINYPRTFKGNPDHSSISLNILASPVIPSLLPKSTTANRHSHTLLLYLKTAVYNFADSTNEFIITNLEPSGKLIAWHLIGLN